MFLIIHTCFLMCSCFVANLLVGSIALLDFSSSPRVAHCSKCDRSCVGRKKMVSVPDVPGLMRLWMPIAELMVSLDKYTPNLVHRENLVPYLRSAITDQRRTDAQVSSQGALPVSHAIHAHLHPSEARTPAVVDQIRLLIPADKTWERGGGERGKGGSKLRTREGTKVSTRSRCSRVAPHAISV